VNEDEVGEDGVNRLEVYRVEYLRCMDGALGALLEDQIQMNEAAQWEQDELVAEAAERKVEPFEADPWVAVDWVLDHPDARSVVRGLLTVAREWVAMQAFLVSAVEEPGNEDVTGVEATQQVQRYLETWRGTVRAELGKRTN